MFPEGGFLRKRRETSQAFAKKNNLPFLTHVTLPRIGATNVILSALVARQENGSPAGGDAKELGMMTFSTFSFVGTQGLSGVPEDNIIVLFYIYNFCQIEIIGRRCKFNFLTFLFTEVSSCLK